MQTTSHQILAGVWEAQEAVTEAQRGHMGRGELADLALDLSPLRTPQMEWTGCQAPTALPHGGLTHLA